jgi:hypothetical protein
MHIKASIANDTESRPNLSEKQPEKKKKKQTNTEHIKLA